MQKTIIFGNSGSGKSTLAKAICEREGLALLDLDVIAWKPVSPPERRVIEDSQVVIKTFLDANEGWVIEGGYADLLKIVLPFCTELIYLNLPVSECIENAKARPWEPHKYSSKTAQDKNLAMLLNWIEEYQSRDDVFSKSAHDTLYESFEGDKIMHTRRQDYVVS